jgi:hypothetical protein
MGLGVGYLDQGDPGTYRAQRGRVGADELMVRDVGMGGRYVITTGDAELVNSGIAALPRDWRRVFDPNSPAFAVLVLGTLLFLIVGGTHRAGGLSVQAGLKAGS